MNTSTQSVKALLILMFISFLPFMKDLNAQTEYLGNIIHEGRADDRRWGPLPIGFDFEFFGNTYNEFFVSSNGLVLFGAGSNLFSNVTIPNVSRPDNYIAPFWDDLIIHETGDIMYQTIGTAPNRKLVIQFSNMSFWTSTVLLGTIQVILYEGSNNIQMQYMSIVDRSSDRSSGNSATIGLENIDGTAGVLCSYNTAGYIYSGRTILFTPLGDSYSFDDQALYEDILLVSDIPKAGIPVLLSPIHNSSVEATVTFMWEAASHATSYFVLISQNADMSSPLHTSADLTNLTYTYDLTPEQTYYWSANARNSTGDITWSEIWSFKTSFTPQLTAVPQTAQLEQGQLLELTLLHTGGDGASKTATISSLPAEGTLYQSNSGTPGAQISTVPTDLTDPFHHVFYSADGAAGSGAGSFDFYFTDGAGSSPEATYTVHVSPPGTPNFLFAAKETDRVEITFDRPMADPSGFHAEFSVEDNGVGVTSTSCALKEGDLSTIVVHVSPSLNTANPISLAYTRGSVTAANGAFLESFDFQLASKLAQTISFDDLPERTFGDPDFLLSAMASSGLAVTFNSANSTIVSLAGATASVNNAGETYITASQAGDASYAAASYKRLQLVNKASATVTLSDLDQSFTGSGIAATASTTPAGLAVHVTYDGSTTLPVDPGTYLVMAMIVDGNYAGSASATLSISDLEGPVPDIPVLPVLSDECSVTPVAPTATDLRAGQVTGTTGTPFPITTQGTTVITWTYDDGQGNTSTQTQNVVIDDQNAPVIPVLADLTVDCSEMLVAPSTTDNCAGTITGTTIDPMVYDGQGSYVVNWTFDDGNGNVVSATQNVIVSDLTPPTATIPEDVSTCDGRVNSIGLTDVSDNCAAMPSVTYVLTGATEGGGTGDASGEIFSPGVTTVSYTVADGHGNSSQYQLSVTYQPVEDIVVSLTDGTFSCETSGACQWINCADNSIIAGETNNSFRPGVSGEYAVIVTQGSCSDTSDCFSIDYTGVNDFSAMEYQVYPNPATDRITIEMDREHTNASLKVFDVTGKLVKMVELDRFTEIQMEVSDLKSGLYMIHILSDQMNAVARIMKE